MRHSRAVFVVSALALVTVRSDAQSFRSRTDGVTVDVFVSRGDRPVADLQVDDFELTDSGVRQRIIEAVREKMPLDVTILADVSSGGLLFSSVAAGVERIRQSLQPGDRARLVTFDERLHDHGPFTTADRLPRVPQRAATDAFAPANETVLFDAVASVLPAPRDSGRRPLVLLFSAGRDTRSRLVSAQVLELARRADLAVFVVHAHLNFAPTERPPDGATPRPVPVVSHSVPARFYRELAELTGGSVQTVEPLTVIRHDSAVRSMRARVSHDGLAKPFLTALDQFRSSYVLRYTPRDARAHGWREITVRVIKPGTRYSVRARKGYFVE